MNINNMNRFLFIPVMFQKNSYKGYMTKPELQQQAQPFSDFSFAMVNSVLTGYLKSYLKI